MGPVPAETLVLSLTGPDSHTVERAAGQGNIVIGPPNPGGYQPHLIVGPDDRIDWSVFDPFTTPAGSPWPRWFSYRGNDTGFIEWSAGRPVERFHWTPATAVDIDAAKAHIVDFAIVSSAHAVNLVVPSVPGSLTTFSISGDLALFQVAVADGAKGPDKVTFGPKLAGSREAEPYRLPDFSELARDARMVAVAGEPLGQALDCGSLLQFGRASAVDVSGNLVGLSALLELPELTSLTVTHSPDLSSMPPLASFSRLIALMVSNVEETAGKRLRSELRKLMKAGDREWQLSWVSELRKPEWFVEEYGLPFDNWSAKAAKAATKAYKTAAAAIAGASAVAEVEAAVREFTRTFNSAPGIDTPEAEDLGDAVRLLAANAPLDVAPELAEGWFDAERDY